MKSGTYKQLCCCNVWYYHSMCVTLEAKLTIKVCQFYVKNISRAQTRILQTHRRICACKHKDWFPVWWETSGALEMGFPTQGTTTGLLACIGCTVQCMQWNYLFLHCSSNISLETLHGLCWEVSCLLVTWMICQTTPQLLLRFKMCGDAIHWVEYC